MDFGTITSLVIKYLLVYEELLDKSSLEKMSKNVTSTIGKTMPKSGMAGLFQQVRHVTYKVLSIFVESIDFNGSNT